MELSNRKDIDVFVTGGHLRGDWFSLVGPSALASLNVVFADIAFLGVNGIDAQHGLTCFNEDEAEINRTMALRSRRRIALVDHSKLGVIAKWQFCQSGNIDMLITDTGATEESVAPFSAMGIEVRCV